MGLPLLMLTSLVNFCLTGQLQSTKKILGSKRNSLHRKSGIRQRLADHTTHFYLHLVMVMSLKGEGPPCQSIQDH